MPIKVYGIFTSTCWLVHGQLRLGWAWIYKGSLFRPRTGRDVWFKHVVAMFTRQSTNESKSSLRIMRKRPYIDERVRLKSYLPRVAECHP